MASSTSMHHIEHARLLKALANEHRLKVMEFLYEAERSVGWLAGQLGVSDSSLSQHLSRLLSVGIVSRRRDAQTIYYRANSSKVAGILNVLICDIP